MVGSEHFFGRLRELTEASHLVIDKISRSIEEDKSKCIFLLDNKSALGAPVSDVKNASTSISCTLISFIFV